MPDTPTPAPALTDEQMGSSPADDAQIDDDVRALVEGESMPEETAWAIIAAVVARAKREERERIARGIANLIDAARVKQETEDALNPDRDGDLGYRNGELDGLSNALLITEATR